MSTALTKVEQGRQNLSTALTQNIDYVRSVIPLDKEEEFKTNFMELAQNSYLMDKIPPKEVLITALNATKMGLNVNPIYKELYILPFNVKGKGMVASIVITFNGNAQMAYDKGFFLSSDPVFLIQGKAKRKSEIPVEQLITIKTTDKEWVKDNTLGWYIGLKDISSSEIQLPYQEVFVEFSYALHVAKELQSPDHLLQTLLHKVIRRAITEMVIPRGRGFVAPEEFEGVVVKDETTKSEATQTVDLSKQKPVETVEAEVEEIVVTVQDVMDYYLNSEDDKKVLIQGVMGSNPDWRTYDSKKLGGLMEEIKGL